MTTDLCSLSATELLHLYRTRQASPVEATKAVLARIEKLNPVLNSFNLVAAEPALAAARESETRWGKAAPMGLLDGVPTSIKDLLLTRGWPTLRGSKTVDAKGPWNDDAPCVARLREQVHLSPDELAELEAGIAEADRGEMIPGDEFFARLRRHG